MHMLKDTKSLAVTALMAAFTCIATMSIRIPTPTLGYIHPGDCLVLLCGVILGPVAGFLAAGIGSMFADILSGYIIYAIPTLIIKGVTALIAAGIPAELNMVFGYFANKIIQTMFLAGSCNSETFATGFASALTGIFTNCVQGAAGVVLGMLLLPVLSQIPDVRLWLTPKTRKSL